MKHSCSGPYRLEQANSAHRSHERTPTRTCDDEHRSSVGDEVIAIGSPLGEGLERSISQGIVSSIRLIDGIKVIQTDAAINPGSSGGPLIHLASKRVLGVVTLGARGADGIGFAVPSDTIQGFLRAHMKNGSSSAAADGKPHTAR